VVSIARQVVSEEVLQAPDILRDTVQAAIQALPRGADNIQIFLNPDDKKLLAAVGNLPTSFNDIQVDASLARGGCRVETRESTVDYTLDYRFRQAIAQQVRKQYSSEQLAILSESIDLPEREEPNPAQPNPVKQSDGIAPS
jgi:flagellar assembly protein FliH